MEIHQLKTFVTVAKEGSITRSAELLYLSQPAVSAHIKAMEDSLGLILFERTPRGMSLTNDGKRLLIKAEKTLAAHRELLSEATQIKGRLTGKLDLGSSGDSSTEAMSRLLTAFAERYPEVNVSLRHGTSLEILNAIRNGSLDAGFYNEAGHPGPELTTINIADFSVFLTAPQGLLDLSLPINWQTLAELPWICPSSSTCCGGAAENLFTQHQFRPRKIISIDNEKVTRTLIAGGVGVGLLHAGMAREAQVNGEIDLLCEVQKSVRVLFAHLLNRQGDPLIQAATHLLRTELTV